MLFFLSILLSFCCINASAVPPQNLPSIVMIFLSVFVTLFALKQSFIALYQSLNIFLFLLNYLGSGTIDLWFTTSVGTSADTILAISTSVPAHILDIFFFGCLTNSTLLNLLSFSSSLSWLGKIAKSLFIFFSFLFFYLGLTTQRGVWESVMSQVSHSHSHMIGHMIGMGK